MKRNRDCPPLTLPVAISGASSPIVIASERSERSNPAVPSSLVSVNRSPADMEAALPLLCSVVITTKNEERNIENCLRGMVGGAYALMKLGTRSRLKAVRCAQ